MLGARLVFISTLVLVGLFSPVAAEAQEAAKVARIGYLGTNLAAGLHMQEAFLQGLRDLGYVEGRNLVIEYRDAEGRLDRLPALAADLVALRVLASATVRQFPRSSRADAAGRRDDSVRAVRSQVPAQPVSIRRHLVDEGARKLSCRHRGRSGGAVCFVAPSVRVGGAREA